ncbi:hypothetical protein LVJ94_03170 [Pendulispora rubella]|uniref:Esterase n=1 Tax=Pendulispora rubella TaxID=2741070 RepID=A0ABZ2L5M9_9BACT
MNILRCLSAASITVFLGCASSGSDEQAPTTVRVHYPVGARTLTLTSAREPRTGTYLGDDTWEFSFDGASSALSVKPVLDGVPARGPDYGVRAGERVDIYPHFFQVRGSVSTRWPEFKSTVHPRPDGMGRPIEVYLPPSYEENPTARFPVIYMMDGQAMFSNWVIGPVVLGDALVDDALDAAAETGAIAETIVVGIDSPVVANASDPLEDRHLELTPTNAFDPTGSVKKSGDGPKFLSMLVDELKPLVDAELRTRPARESTFIGGGSLGGLMSAYAGVTRGDVFGGIVSLSGSAWWDDRLAVRMVRDAKTGPRQTLKVYADVGGGEVYPETDLKDLMIASNRDLFQAYTDAGYVEGRTLMTLVSPAVDPGNEHNATHFGRRIPSALAFVIGPGR